ncbi:MAG: hypothetical protein ACHQ1H_00870 [Nitrososphaerales archaeon]
MLFIILFQLAPLIAGVAVAESQIVRKIILRPLALITGAAGVVLIGLVVIIGLAVISVIGVVPPALVFILTLFSLGVGWILGGPTLINRKVLAINSALRNFPVGLLMATSIFSDTEIAASVAVFAAIMILTVLVFTRLVSRFHREEVWTSPVVSSEKKPEVSR